MDKILNFVNVLQQLWLIFISMDQAANVFLATCIECQVFWAVNVRTLILSEILQFGDTGLSSLLGNFVQTVFFVSPLKFSQKRKISKETLFIVKLLHPEGKFRKIYHLLGTSFKRFFQLERQNSGIIFTRDISYHGLRHCAVRQQVQCWRKVITGEWGSQRLEGRNCYK